MDQGKIIDFWAENEGKWGGKAIVIFSGGQDSTTCLGIAIKTHGAENVHCIIYEYGQKHEIEVLMAKRICADLNIEYTVICLDMFKHMSSSALINHGDVNVRHSYLKDLPASFVPVRNAMFITVAFGLAMEMAVKYIYIGTCQTDYSGYPDCREDFIRKLAFALNIGYESNIGILFPIMNIDKAHTFELAKRVDILDMVLDMSHTCYNGIRDKFHDWGHGCDDCPACLLRKKGYEEWRKL